MTGVEKVKVCFVCSSDLNSSCIYQSPDWRQDYLAITIIPLIFPLDIFGVIFPSEIKPSLTDPSILGNFSSNGGDWEVFVT